MFALSGVVCLCSSSCGAYEGHAWGQSAPGGSATARSSVLEGRFRNILGSVSERADQLLKVAEKPAEKPAHPDKGGTSRTFLLC